MCKRARSRGIVLGLLSGFLLLGTGCAGMHSQAASKTPPQAQPRGTPDRSPVAPGRIIIVTDQTGTLVGAMFVPVAEQVVVKEADLMKPEDIDKIPAEKTFLAPGLQTIVIFGMGDPCQYVSQGGKAVKKCSP